MRDAIKEAKIKGRLSVLSVRGKILKMQKGSLAENISAKEDLEMKKLEKERVKKDIEETRRIE